MAENPGMRNYERIEAWKLADELVLLVYQVTRRFPQHEIHGLTGQLRRAAVSVAANIAEGSARESKKDYGHFLTMARASLTEAHYLAHLAARLGYLIPDQVEAVGPLFKRTFACLNALIAAVAQR